MQTNIDVHELTGSVELTIDDPNDIGIRIQTGSKADKTQQGVAFWFHPSQADSFAAFLEATAELARHSLSHVELDPDAEENQTYQGQGQTQGKTYVHDNGYDEAKCQEGDYSDLATRTLAHDHRTGFTRG